MKSIRFRLAVAAVAVMLGSAIANSQTADTTPPPPPAHGSGMFGIDASHDSVLRQGPGHNG